MVLGERMRVMHWAERLHAQGLQVGAIREPFATLHAEAPAS